MKCTIEIALFIAVTLGVGFASAATIATSVSGNGIQLISRDVQEWHDGQRSDCRYKKVIGVEIVKRDETFVTEHWTIQACHKKQFTYEVLIMVSEHGLSDVVSNIDHSPVDPPKP